MKKNKNKYTRKKTLIFIVLSVLLMLIVNNTILSTISFFDIIMDKSFHSRRVSITIYPDDRKKIDEIYEFLDNIEEVDAYYAEANGFNLTKKEISNQLLEPFFNSFNYDAYKDYLEDKSIKELKDNEIIIPRYVSEEYLNMFLIESDDQLHDMHEFLGEHIKGYGYKINYSDFEIISTDVKYDFKIVGFYDNIAAGTDNHFLINEDIIINASKDRYIFDNKEDEENFMKYENVFFMEALADSYKSVDIVAKKIGEKFPNIEAYNSGIMDPEFFEKVDMIALVVNFIVFFVIVNTIINMFFFVENDIKKRRKEFGILKALGYTNKQVVMNLVIENLKLGSLGFVISLGLYMVYQVLGNIIIDSTSTLYYNLYDINLHPETILVALFVSLIVTAIGLLSGILRVSKLDPIEALKDYE